MVPILPAIGLIFSCKQMEKTAGDLPPSKTCGSCRRVGIDLKICTACRSVHYCDVSCQKAHRKAHKKGCKEIAHANQVMEEFKANPMTEECPICMMRLPLLANEFHYESCCGKTLCDGCVVASWTAQGAAGIPPPCAFCRRPVPSGSEELLERVNKRIDEYGDSMALNTLAGKHSVGKGVPKDDQKAFECNVKASEMGNVHGTYNVAVAYGNGEGVPIDKKKAKIYFETAAKNGHVEAIARLADIHAENPEVRVLYRRLAAESGHEESMEYLKKLYHLNADALLDHNEGCSCDGCKIFKTKGLLTKDDLADTIRAFHSAQEELRSDERDLARSGGGGVVPLSSSLNLFEPQINE